MRRPPPASAASLIRQLDALVRGHALLAPGERAVVAISGGVDSTCLLHCLHAMAPPLDLQLHVAYVHHGLRAAADDDAAFVADMAAAYGLPCAVLHADVAALRGGRSLQDAARNARYAALRGHAASLGATAIVTGHTEDDQAETLLLHLLRGSGLDGLAGMRLREPNAGAGDTTPVRGYPEVAAGPARIVRPLLRTSRAAIVAHCRAHGLAWREDASNASRAYRRNAVRHDMLPAMEAYNPRLRAALARTAATLALDADYLRTQAAGALDGLIIEANPAREPAPPAHHPPSLRLDRARYAALPDALRLHTLRLALERLLGGTAGFTQGHLAAIDDLACGGRTGSRANLPRRIRVDAGTDVLHISVGEQRAAAGVIAAGVAAGDCGVGGQQAPASGDAPDHGGGRGDPQHLPAQLGEVPLPVPGVASFGHWRIEAAIVSLGDMGPGSPASDEGQIVVYCDPGIGTALTVRGRRPGDRLRPLGLGGSKKLQDLLVDRKVPRHERDAVPLVVGLGGIIWVVSHALDERARIAPGATVVIRLVALARAGIRAEGGL